LGGERGGKILNECGVRRGVWVRGRGLGGNAQPVGQERKGGEHKQHNKKRWGVLLTGKKQAARSNVDSGPLVTKGRNT